MNVLTKPAAQPLQCFDIWGSNKRALDAVSVPGIDAWIQSIPYGEDEQGGDIHYISMCGAGAISRFALLDVSGHGELAGSLANCLRQLMRKHINTLDQTRFAQAINQEFTKYAKFGNFATALLTTYFAPTDHLVICNAGHPRPLWFQADTGIWSLLDERFENRTGLVENVPFGVVDSTDYVQFAVRLQPGDIVIMYTDALNESRNAAGEQLGEEGLLDLVQNLDRDDLSTLTQRIIDGAANFRGNAPVDDDQTVLVLHHNAANPPRQSITDKMKVMAKMVGLIRV